MPKNKPAQASATTEVVTEPSHIEMLEAFVELVGERYGYNMARRLTQKDMNEKTKEESKTAREISKAISENLENLIKTPDAEIAQTIVTKREELKEARNVLKTARKPFNEKIKPLASAIKYCDNVAIPDSMKELGQPVVPRFSLSDWAQKALADLKKKD